MREKRRDRFAFRVDGNGQSQRLRLLHTAIKRQIVDARKILDAAVGHEGFESDDAAIGQFLQSIEIARDQSAPQRKIRQRASAGFCGF